MLPLRKQILLCTLGTVFEWYEFTIFGLLAPFISSLFFPKSNHFAGLMLTFAVFASGYIMRPIGALFFGHIGDTLGRKYSLLMTIFLMAASTFALGLIPVGTSLSTWLLVICRLVQGFSASGEYPGGLTMLAEQPNQKHRALVASFTVFATSAGSFVGAALCAIILKTLGNEKMLLVGWRIPFLLAAPLGILSLWLRQSIFESGEFKKIQEQKRIQRAPIIKIFTQHGKNFSAMLCISILTNVLGFINLFYFGSYSLSIHKLSSTDTVNLYLLITMIYAVSILFFGFVADYVNKKTLLLIACVLVLCFAYPLFQLALGESIGMQFLAQGLLAFLLGMISGPFSLVLADSFPTEVRYTGLSITLNIAGAVFGGTAPIVCGWLSKFMGTPLAPAYYMIFIASIAVAAVIYIMMASQKLIFTSLVRE